MRLLGLDPGLRHTGWGVVDVFGNRLVPVAAGAVHSDGKAPLPTRLVELFRQLEEVLERHRPDEAAVEETFVNKNPASTLKLGVARGIVLLAPALRGIPVAEYSANLIKKSVVGVGHADKAQVEMMVRRLLPGIEATADAADALAVAICHAHHASSQRAWGTAPTSPLPSGEREGPVAKQREGEGRDAPSGAKSAGAIAPAPSSRPSPRRGEGGDLPVEAKRLPTFGETARARRLRRDGTNVEKLLWQKIRAGQLDEVKFRRQEPILGFTVDFVAHSHRLVIELDGGQHAETVAGTDERRSRILEQAGFRVLRFWNNDVIDNLDGVLETIRSTLAGPGPSA